jgi:hypothetical protein
MWDRSLARSTCRLCHRAQPLCLLCRYSRLTTSGIPIWRRQYDRSFDTSQEHQMSIVKMRSMQRSGNGIRSVCNRGHKSKRRTNLKLSTLYLKRRNCGTMAWSRVRGVTREKAYPSLSNHFMNRYLMRRRSWRQVEHWMQRGIGIVSALKPNTIGLSKGFSITIGVFSLEQPCIRHRSFGKALKNNFILFYVFVYFIFVLSFYFF